ncbi:MAG: molybdenum cofactor guanylyltransferase [Saprospiraceae bacterium]
MLNAPLWGLALAGGLSTRMGTDKGLIAWHGKPQREHLLDLFRQAELPACLSIRPDQMPKALSTNCLIPDRYGAIGPAGALRSAMEAYPGRAWLVIACDLPLVTVQFLQWLMQHRDPAMLFTGCATAFGPEPLAAIWEPAAGELLARFTDAGAYSLRRILENQAVKIVAQPDSTTLLNANSPEDCTTIRQILAV